MRLLLLACAGGALGAGARHLVNVGFGRWLGVGFPWSTLTVNVFGCFLMGVLIEAFALRYSSSLEMRTFLATGILGGFTTFSAFSMDFALLIEKHLHGPAMFYVAFSVGLSLIAIFAGIALTRALLT